MESLHEEWQPVVGLEGQYEVSNRGQVRSVEHSVMRGELPMKVRGKILRPWMCGSGYLTVALGRSRRFQVHRLVTESFIGASCGRHVNHLDGNKLNNCRENLEYVTPKENTAHAMATGLMPRNGANNPAAKHTAEQIKKAHSIVSAGATYREACDATGVSMGSLVSVLRGAKWQSLGLPKIRRMPAKPGVAT